MALTALYFRNDHLTELVGLRDAASGEYINGAAVQLTLVDAAGTEVTGQSWPTTMSYVSSSDGKYRAILEDTLDLEILEQYRAVIEVDTGSLQARWDIPCIARYRAA